MHQVKANRRFSYSGWSKYLNIDRAEPNTRSNKRLRHPLGSIPGWPQWRHLQFKEQSPFTDLPRKSGPEQCVILVLAVPAVLYNTRPQRLRAPCGRGGFPSGV